MNHPFFIQPPADFIATHRHLLPLAARLSEAFKDAETIVTDDLLRAVGSALWDAIGNINVGESTVAEALKQAKAACGLQPLSIIVQSQCAATLSLLWESVYHPEFGFLGREAGFTL